MNFKPTILKVILSIILGFALDAILFVIIAPRDIPSGANIFRGMFLTTFFIAIVIAYIIWSFLQKK